MLGIIDLPFYIIIFIFGCVIGSFLNVVIDRLPSGHSIVYPPSHCPHCRHRLAIWDLIPLFSFFYLRGRCRYCNKKISLYYPLIEVATGALFVITTFIGIHQPVGSFIYFPEFIYLIYLLFIVSSLIIIFFIDLKYGIIPFKIIMASLAVITIWYLFVNFECVMSNGIASSFLLAMTSDCEAPILNYFLSGMGVFAGFLLLFLFTRGRGIGFGDVVFGFFMGYVLGFPKIVLGVYISFLTGAFISLILIMARKKKFKGGVIPFGPFLVSGTVISLFWGEIIINKFLLYFHVI